MHCIDSRLGFFDIGNRQREDLHGVLHVTQETIFIVAMVDGTFAKPNEREVKATALHVAHKGQTSGAKVDSKIRLCKSQKSKK